MEKLAKYDTRKSLSPLGTGNTNQLVHLQSLNRLNRVHQCLELIHLRLKIKKKIFQKFNQTNFLKGLDILKPIQGVVITNPNREELPTRDRKESNTLSRNSLSKTNEQNGLRRARNSTQSTVYIDSDSSEV